VQRTVKLEVPVAVGVPLIVPFDQSIQPEGRLPPLSDHEYGVLAAGGDKAFAVGYAVMAPEAWSS